MAILDAVQQALQDRHRLGVVGAHPGAFLLQALDDVDRRRLPDVVGVGLIGEPENRDHLVTQPAEHFAELLDEERPLVDVDLHDGIEQLRVIAKRFGHPRQRLDVLGETGASVADAGIEEEGTDPAVEPHAFRHDLDIGIDPLANSRDLVDERNSSGEECVRGVLDHLGSVEIGDEDRRVELAVQRSDRLGGALVVRAEHQPIGVHEVVDRRPLLEELRVRHVADLAAAAYRAARAHRHRALHDDGMVVRFPELPDHGLDA